MKLYKQNLKEATDEEVLEAAREIRERLHLRVAEISRKGELYLSLPCPTCLAPLGARCSAVGFGPMRHNGLYLSPAHSHKGRRDEAEKLLRAAGEVL